MASINGYYAVPDSKIHVMQGHQNWIQVRLLLETCSHNMSDKSPGN